MKITYNTAEARLPIPAYGRLVQQMIDRVQGIQDPHSRQHYAERIVRVMETLNPALKSRPDYRDILWNHLAYMAHYKLEIQYPCPIEERKDERPAHKLSYPGHKIQYRHYGALIEQAAKQLAEMSAGDRLRKETIRNLGARMKRCLAQWRGEGAENEKVARDLEEYTEGRVKAEEVMNELATMKIRTPQYSKPFNERRPRIGGRKKFRS